MEFAANTICALSRLRIEIDSQAISISSKESTMRQLSAAHWKCHKVKRAKKNGIECAKCAIVARVCRRYEMSRSRFHFCTLFCYVDRFLLSGARARTTEIVPKCPSRPSRSSDRILYCLVAKWVMEQTYTQYIHQTRCGSVRAAKLFPMAVREMVYETSAHTMERTRNGY